MTGCPLCNLCGIQLKSTVAQQPVTSSAPHNSDMDETESHLLVHQTPRRVPRIRTVSVPSQPTPRANGSLKPGRRPLSPMLLSYALGGQTCLRFIDQSPQ